MFPAYHEAWQKEEKSLKADIKLFACGCWIYFNKDSFIYWTEMIIISRADELRQFFGEVIATYHGKNMKNKKKSFNERYLSENIHSRVTIFKISWSSVYSCLVSMVNVMVLPIERA